MGARLRAVILLFALIGVAFAFVFHLATKLFNEGSRRQEMQRFYDVVGVWSEGLAPRGLSAAELEEEASSLRENLGFQLWVVATPKDARRAVFPAADAHHLKELLTFADLGSLPPEVTTCDIRFEGAVSGPFCRVGFKGYGVQGFVVSSAAAFALRDSPYLRILAIVAAVAWLFLGIAGYFAFTFFFVTPLGRVVLAMERASSRESGPYLDPAGAPEFQAIARAFNDMVKKQQTSHDRIRYQLDELKRTHRELGTARASLVRSEQLAQVGVLAAGVAHEVGNPLGLISGYVEILAEGDISQAQRKEYLERIEAALDRIQRVLRNLLDFSRGDDDEEPARASIGDVTGSVSELVRPQARFRDVSVHLDLPGDLPFLCIPPSRLEQVMLNLMMNAADAAGPGGNIWVRASGEGKMLRVFVEDDGAGIEEKDLDRIFQPFVTTKSKGSGTGLGLFVCQHLITAYGGEISASNGEEGGAIFEFLLWSDEGEPEGEQPVG